VLAADIRTGTSDFNPRTVFENRTRSLTFQVGYSDIFGNLIVTVTEKIGYS